MYRIAVVTPYYKEKRSVLQQCHDSVLRQTYKCDHILIADGFPSDLFDDGPGTIHVKLPKGNNDNGNTPRAIGGILSESYGYNAVAYLDADNWFDPDHVEKLVAAHDRTGAPLIGCKRRFYDLDENELDITEPSEDTHRHIDTSCWLVFRPAFSLLSAWRMPKILSPVCDRIFFQTAIHERFRITTTKDRTVCFRTQYEYHYRLAGKALQPGLKTSEEVFRANRYIATRKGAAEIVRALGFYPILVG